MGISLAFTHLRELIKDIVGPGVVSKIQIVSADTAFPRVHPTLDILATGGRDAAVRVWDMRTRANIFTLSGHTSTVADVQAQSAEPQIISGSMDSTIRYALSPPRGMCN